MTGSWYSAIAKIQGLLKQITDDKLKFTITLLILMLLLISWPLLVFGYVDTSTPHNPSLFDMGRYWKRFCLMCHPGFAQTGTSMGSWPFEAYRCLACHYSIGSTHQIAVDNSESAHRSLQCLVCHDVFHYGHETYSTGTVYGCKGPHDVLAPRTSANPPQNPTVYWANFHYVTTRQASGWNIVVETFFYNTPPSNIPTPGRYRDYPIYVTVYGNPYTKDLTTPPQGKLYLFCYKCHFINNPNLQQYSTVNYQTKHPEPCYRCHSRNEGGTPYTLAPHSIYPKARGSWSKCSSCHTGISSMLSQSVHRSFVENRVGCICHGIVHVSGYNMTGSWLPLYYPYRGLLITPTLTEVLRGRHLFFYTDVNSTTYNIPVKPVWTGNDETHIVPVYTIRYDATFMVYYNTRMFTCFNCHFISWNEVAAGASPNLNITLAQDPHSIMKYPRSASSNGTLSQPPASSDDHNRPIAVFVSLAALVSSLIIVAIGARKP